MPQNLVRTLDAKIRLAQLWIAISTTTPVCQLHETIQHAFRSVRKYKGQAHETIHFVSCCAPAKTYQYAFRSVQTYKGQAHKTIHVVSFRAPENLILSTNPKADIEDPICNNPNVGENKIKKCMGSVPAGFRSHRLGSCVTDF